MSRRVALLNIWAIHWKYKGSPLLTLGQPMMSQWVALLDIWAIHCKYKGSSLSTLGWPILQGGQPIASNKSQSIISQSIFALREINQMEHEICLYLEWQLNIDLSQLQDFESKVRQDFKWPGLYPNYVFISLASTPMPSTTPYATASLYLPSFISSCGLSTSPLKPAISDPSLTTPLYLKTNSYYRHKETAKTCAHFVTHLFVCSDLPSPSITNPSTLSSILIMLIACTLHCTCLHASVIFLC